MSPAPPNNMASDWLVSRADFIELVTVESLDPDTPPPGDVLATATGVQGLAGRPEQSEVPVGEGTVAVTKRNFTLVAAQVGFTVKTRDLITRSDETQWLILGTVVTGGYGALFSCPDCVLQR